MNIPERSDGYQHKGGGVKVFALPKLRKFERKIKKIYTRRKNSRVFLKQLSQSKL